MTRHVLIAVGGLAVIIGVAVAILVLTADGDDEAEAAPDATPTLTAGDFGPPPVLGDYVVDVFPAHASAIPQANTRTTDPDNPRGVCFEASFDGLDSNAGLWFRMAVDEEEVTTEGIWIVASRESPEGGRFCYDPPEGLEVGIHTAAVSVSDPSNPNASPRQVVGWAFEVIE